MFEWPGFAQEDSNPTSTNFLLGVKADDPRAWDRFVRVYGCLVYRWCRRAGLQGADAADVSQEVFRAVLGHVAEFHRERPGDSFRGWLRTITTNKLHDFRRRRGKRPRPVLAGLDPGGVVLPDPSDDADVDRLEEANLVLKQALRVVRDEFEPATWQAFQKTVLDDRPVREVADELGRSANAVYLARSRVLRRLREVLEGE